MASSFQTFFRSFNPQTAPKSISHSSHSKLICMQLKPNKLQPISTQTREIPALVSPIKLSNVETKHTRTMDASFAQHSQKIELFRNVMRNVAEIDALDGLNMIDAVQRLGIDYHFQAEIDEILNKQMSTVSDANNDLHEASLRFRLMRQHGYFVPEDVFNNFRESNGMFKQDLAKDIKGLMSLYEASQLAIEGEDTLVEAENFSGHLLRTSMFQLDHDHARMVANTLSNPHHNSLASFMVKNFLKSQATNPWLSFLKEAANTDFDMVKSLYQNEIIQISKWWNELGLAKELKFARDQPLKWYISSLAGLKDPKFSEERVELTKSIAFIYLIDDIFDVYGTLDELILFTEAVNRWEISAIDHLPDYMKISFKALYDMTDEISCKVFEKHGWNPLKSLKMTWASLCNAFLVEAKWFASGQLPKSEEYLKNGIVSSGVNVALVHLFFLLGQNITGQSVELLNDTPSIVSSAAAILRLWDDLGSAEDENQDGNDGSYVRCYLKEHEDCSIEEAREKTRGMIADEWKKLNKELLSPNPFPATFTSACLDLARMVPLMYSYDDNQCLPSLQEYINLMLHETVSME